MDRVPIAHSAPHPSAAPQHYSAHVRAVAAQARARVKAMVQYHPDPAGADAMARAVVDAAVFHDFGKLDPQTQDELRKGRDQRLTWDHVDAGVAYLRSVKALTAAWLVRAHHAPGLPSSPVHFPSAVTKGNPNYRYLRGRRHDDADPSRHRGQIDRTDAFLPDMLERHRAAFQEHQPRPGRAMHGLPLRLMLSCLVDADHGDTAAFDKGWQAPPPPPPRWTERLAALDAHVAGLPGRNDARDGQRRAFYNACRHGGPENAAMVACEGPVGIGKTTAVTAWLLRRAIMTKARRLIIVAPFTAILSQTAMTLRQALLLSDEQGQADSVVAEHHHRADFSDISSRDLATLWTAPIILTTAVQFFETLASNQPSVLRKLHALPGSVVFLDKAHAALPNPLWAQNWRWLNELATDWSCSFAFASGSLARFWQIPDMIAAEPQDSPVELPELVPQDMIAPLRQAEKRRITYRTLGLLHGPEALADAVAQEAGPRLLILYTVQSAAVMARHMRRKGQDVLHLSTALSPRDREAILARVTERLRDGHSGDWTLVATSLVEAGVDLSFRTAFRERFSTASLIQTGGRLNRHGEYAEGASLHDFTILPTGGLRLHPAAKVPADILDGFFQTGLLAGDIDAAALTTRAMRQEMRRIRSFTADKMVKAEKDHDYPEVAQRGRVIAADTRLVVVDPALCDRLTAQEPVSTRSLLGGSVQIRASRISSFGLEPIPGRPEIAWWHHAYDPSFLGYMEGALLPDDLSDALVGTRRQ